jgi:hypothetical protein
LLDRLAGTCGPASVRQLLEEVDREDGMLVALAHASEQEVDEAIETLARTYARARGGAVDDETLAEVRQSIRDELQAHVTQRITAEASDEVMAVIRLGRAAAEQLGQNGAEGALQVVTSAIDGRNRGIRMSPEDARLYRDGFVNVLVHLGLTEGRARYWDQSAQLDGIGEAELGQLAREVATCAARRARDDQIVSLRARDLSSSPSQAFALFTPAFREVAGRYGVTIDRAGEVAGSSFAARAFADGLRIDRLQDEASVRAVQAASLLASMALMPIGGPGASFALSMGMHAAASLAQAPGELRDIEVARRGERLGVSTAGLSESLAGGTMYNWGAGILINALPMPLPGPGGTLVRSVVREGSSMVQQWIEGQHDSRAPDPFAADHSDEAAPPPRFINWPQMPDGSSGRSMTFTPRER